MVTWTEMGWTKEEVDNGDYDTGYILTNFFIMKSGTKYWKITIDDTGEFVKEEITE